MEESKVIGKIATMDISNMNQTLKVLQAPMLTLDVTKHDSPTFDSNKIKVTDDASHQDICQGLCVRQTRSFLEFSHLLERSHQLFAGLRYAERLKH
jgi:hypothetical protein